MPISIRSLLRAVTPGFVRRLRARAFQRAEARRRATEGRLHEALGGLVLSGPFRGMLLDTASSWGPLGPKLLGTYERELAPVIETIIAGGCRRFVDLGAAEGFYAVGLLRRLPAATCVAFEANERGRAMLGDSARANGVLDRLEIRGHCGPHELAAAVAAFHPELVICDVEGAELDLLDPDAIPGLAGVDLLVEIHDFVNPAMGAILARRFAESHAITRIATGPRRHVDIPAVPGFSRAERAILACEQRPCAMEWFWFRARTVRPQTSTRPDG